MLIVLIELFSEKQIAIETDSIKYIEEYGIENRNSKIHYLSDSKAIYVKESLLDIIDLVNNLAKNKNISIQIYYDKTLFPQK